MEIFGAIVKDSEIVGITQVEQETAPRTDGRVFCLIFRVLVRNPDRPDGPFLPIKSDIFVMEGTKENGSWDETLHNIRVNQKMAQFQLQYCDVYDQIWKLIEGDKELPRYIQRIRERMKQVNEATDKKILTGGPRKTT